MEEGEDVNNTEENNEEKKKGDHKKDENDDVTVAEKQANVEQEGEVTISKDAHDGHPDKGEGGERETGTKETPKKEYNEMNQEFVKAEETGESEEETSEDNEMTGAEVVWNEELETGEEGDEFIGLEEFVTEEEGEEDIDEFEKEVSEVDIEEELEEDVIVEEEFDKEYETLQADEEKPEEEEKEAGKEEEEEEIEETEEDEMEEEKEEEGEYEEMYEHSEEDESIADEEHRIQKIKKLKKKRRKKTEEPDKEGEQVTEKESHEIVESEEGADETSVHSTPSQKLLQQENKEKEELFQQLNSLRSEKVTVKTRNIILHRKLVNYFRKRKIDQPIHEFRSSADLENRYHKKLLMYQEFSRDLLVDRKKIIAEWEVLRGHLQNISRGFEDVLEESKQKLLDLRNILIVTSTGKALNEQIMEDSIKQTKIPHDRLTETRLMYIKLKNLVTKQLEERNMHHMGSDFHLTDYEQLCMQKEEFGDKIVERDLEIATVEKKGKDLKQRLVGIKLRLEALEKEIEGDYASINSLELAIMKIREEINIFKEKRHANLEDIYNMKHNSGLITYPELLEDYKETQNLVNKLHAKLDKLKETYKSHQIQNIVATKENNFLSLPP